MTQDTAVGGAVAGAQSGGIRAGIGVFVVIGGVLFNMLLLSSITPILSTIAAHFGASGSSSGQITTQMIITMSGVGIFFGSPIAGWLAERFSLRTVLIGSLALYGLGGSAGLYVETSPELLAARFLQGLAAGGTAITSYAMIGERFQGAARGRVLGYQAAVVAVTGLLANLGSGALAEWGGWRAPFAIYLLAFGMIVLALVGTGIPSGKRHAELNASVGGKHESLFSIWHLYLLLIPLYVASYNIFLQLSFVLAGDGITGPGQQSRILAVITVLHFFTGLFYGRVVERIGTRLTFCLILSAMALANLSIGLGHGVIAMSIGCAFTGIAAGNMVPFVTNLIITRAPESRRGRALGVMYSISYVGQFLNPLIITPLRGVIGNHEAFVVTGAILLTVALVQGLYRGAVQYDVAPQAA